MRWVLILALLAAIVGGIVYFSMSQGYPVEAAQVRRGRIERYVEERATTKLAKTYEITMPLAGRIQPIELRPDDTVEQGQVVASLDPDDLQTDLVAGTARVQQFDQLLQSMQRTVEAAAEQSVASLAKFEYAQQEYQRASNLAEREALDDSQLNAYKLEQFESRVDHRTNLLIEKALSSITTALEIARDEQETQRAKLQRDRDRATITTPVAGVVLERIVANEQVLPAGETLLEIGRMEDLEIEAEILSQEVVEVRKEATVEIFGPAVGHKSMSGRVDRIHPRGFTKVSSLGVEQQRVAVIIKFDQEQLAALRESGRHLGIGYRVRVRIITDAHENTIIVPRSTLFRTSADAWGLYAIRGGRAVLIEPEIGLMNDFEAEILTGLDADESVILAPESSLTNGQTVEVVGD